MLLGSYRGQAPAPAPLRLSELNGDSQKRLTFDIVVNHPLRVQEIQPLENVLGHPDNFELSHGATALELFQDGASLTGLHEQVHGLIPQDGAVQLGDILVPEARLDLHVGRLKLIHGDLEHKSASEILNHALAIDQPTNQKPTRALKSSPGETMFASYLSARKQLFWYKQLWTCLRNTVLAKKVVRCQSANLNFPFI